jgi:hypothetical protein
VNSFPSLTSKSKLPGGANRCAPLRMGGDRCQLHQLLEPQLLLDSLDDAPLKERVELADWDAEGVARLGLKERLHGRGLPHAAFAWGCRLLPGVRAAFAALYPGESLVVGLDVPFFAPADAAPRGELQPGAHVDQNAKLCDRSCYQSILYVWEAAEDCSTTVALPGSHLDVYASLVGDEGRPLNKHFVLLGDLKGPAAKTARAPWKSDARRLRVPAGSLLLWDSRLLHAGWRCGPRLAQPVCWEPKCERKEEARLRKLRYCARGLSTTHSATAGLLHVGHGKTPAPVRGARVQLKGRACGVRSTLPPLPLLRHDSLSEAWAWSDDAASESLLDPRIACLL